MGDERRVDAVCHSTEDAEEQEDTALTRWARGRSLRHGHTVTSLHSLQLRSQHLLLGQSLSRPTGLRVTVPSVVSSTDHGLSFDTLSEPPSTTCSAWSWWSLHLISSHHSATSIHPHYMTSPSRPSSGTDVEWYQPLDPPGWPAPTMRVVQVALHAGDRHFRDLHPIAKTSHLVFPRPNDLYEA